MCECGCTANDERYLFPAPHGKFYMLTLTAGCVACDAGSGVSIELLDKKSFYVQQAEDYTDGDLKFEDWSDSKGVAIITGFRKHEFVDAIKSHLISAGDWCEGNMDEDAAEVLLEEAYQDSVVKPHFPPARSLDS